MYINISSVALETSHFTWIRIHVEQKEFWFRRQIKEIAHSSQRLLIDSNTVSTSLVWNLPIKFYSTHVKCGIWTANPPLQREWLVSLQKHNLPRGLWVSITSSCNHGNKPLEKSCFSDSTKSIEISLEVPLSGFLIGIWRSQFHGHQQGLILSQWISHILALTLSRYLSKFKPVEVASLDFDIFDSYFTCA